MRYLGVDWGLKRIGLAISEGELASPLKTLQVSSLDDALNQIQKVIKSDNIDEVVVGQPEGESGKLVKKAVKAMLVRGLLVEVVDETLSTQNAKHLMIEQNIGQKERRDDNSYSAALILQNYLDEKVS